MTENPDLLKLEDLCRLTNRCRSLVFKDKALGRIETVKIGRGLFVTQKAARDYIELIERDDTFEHYTVMELSELSGKSQTAIYKEIRLGKLTCVDHRPVKGGKYHAVPKEEGDKYIEKHKDLCYKGKVVDKTKISFSLGPLSLDWKDIGRGWGAYE